MKDRKDETLKDVCSKELVETAATHHLSTLIMSFFNCQLAKLSLCFTNCPQICMGALHMSPASCYSISKLLSSKSLGASYGKIVCRLFWVGTSNPYYFFKSFFCCFSIFHDFMSDNPYWDSAVSLSVVWKCESLVIILRVQDRGPRQRHQSPPSEVVT